MSTVTTGESAQAAFKMNPMALVRWVASKIGGITAKDHVGLLKDEGVEVDIYAQRLIFNNGYKPGPERDAEFWRCQVGDLGFDDPPTTTELLERVVQVAAICPSESALHLVHTLGSYGEVHDDRFTVLMEPILDRYNSPFMFDVVSGDTGERSLSGHYAHPSQRWPLDYEVVGLIPS